MFPVMISLDCIFQKLSSACPLNAKSVTAENWNGKSRRDASLLLRSQSLTRSVSWVYWPEITTVPARDSRAYGGLKTRAQSHYTGKSYQRGLLLIRSSTATCIP